MGKKYSLKIIIEGIAGAVFIGFMIVFGPILRGWYRRWGTKSGEAERTLPGDEFVPHPKSEINMAIDIQAPAQKVWPWFAQLGCQRGGWYSYDLLDNGGTPSTEQIIPELQHLKVGDLVAAVPNGSFGFPVADLRENEYLSLAGTINTATGQPGDPHDPELKAYFSGDQTFVIRSLDDKTSRLFFRMRIDWNPSRMNSIINLGIVEPVSFVMGRKMLRKVKRLSEKIKH
jgi:hypothetical protein